MHNRMRSLRTHVRTHTKKKLAPSKNSPYLYPRKTKNRPQMKKIILSLALGLIVSGLSAQNDISYQELKTEELDHITWAYYDCGDVWIYLNHSQVRSMGSYHKIEVYIENHSDTAVTIDPGRDFAARTSHTHARDIHKTQIFNYKEIRRKTSMHRALAGIGAGLLAAGELYLSATDHDHDLCAVEIIEDAIGYGIETSHQRRILKNEYLTPQTIQPGEYCQGFLLIRREPGCKNLYLYVSANGNTYKFAWQGEMHQQGNILRNF